MNEKSFDCVKMKDDIQQRIRNERGSVPWSRRNELIRESLKNDPFLSKLLDNQAPQKKSA